GGPAPARAETPDGHGARVRGREPWGPAGRDRDGFGADPRPESWTDWIRPLPLQKLHGLRRRYRRLAECRAGRALAFRREGTRAGGSLSGVRAPSRPRAPGPRGARSVRHRARHAAADAVGVHRRVERGP